MRFKEAVKSCAYTKYSDFKTRSSRSEFWWFMLGLALVNIVLIGVSQVLPGIGSSMIAGFGLVILCPYAAALVRRLHDVGLSGKWVAAAFAVSVVASTAATYPEFAPAAWGTPAVFLLLFIMALFPGKKAANAYGPAPES